MNSKEALDLAILEYEKETVYDENNQWVKNVLKGLKGVKQYIEQLEKALEILKEVCSLNSNRILETERNLLRVSKQEYELLKEVLYDD